MTSVRRLSLLFLLAGVAGALSLCGCRAGDQPDATCPTASRAPRLKPDYTGTVIPCNIAPLNFSVEEPGTAYFAHLRGSDGISLTVRSRTPHIVMSQGQWRRLVATEGSTLTLEVSVKAADGRWQRFAPVTNTIGPPVDRYLAYRQIGQVFSYFRDIRVMQRDLTGFAERQVFWGGQAAEGCVNCHTFCNNRPELMTLGIRSGKYGNCALVADHGRVTKMDAIWGYNSWHPSGQAVAYSMNKVRQFFHDAAMEVRDVVDLDSDVVVYRADTGAVESDPAIADPDRLETYPSWSPDGKTLYFCSAPILWQDRETVPPIRYADLHYELRRVSYDLASHRFGRPETVLPVEQAGRSILEPRVSPDGRWLLFCMCDYGCFPIYRPSSDLYLMDLRTGAYRRLDINSDQSESWHSWSSNSRWIAFSSRRIDGVFTRTYFAHVDEQGRVAKPFILPQRDPTFYDSFLKTFSVPEFITAPVQTTDRELARAVRSDRKVKLTLPEVSMTRKSKQPSPTEPWQQSNQR